MLHPECSDCVLTLNFNLLAYIHVQMMQCANTKGPRYYLLAGTNKLLR